MQIEPFRVFFGIALVSLIGLAWIHSPWMGISFFYAALSGWLWTLSSIWFQVSLPKMTDWFPSIMLLLFMLVLGAAPAKSTSEALFFTAAGLVLFRSVVYLLMRIRNSKNPIPTVAKVTLLALLLEMTLNAIQVYSTFRPVPAVVLSGVHALSMRGMMLVILVGWLADRKFEMRERRYAWMFALGVIGNPYVSGGMLIANTLTFLRGRGFRYHD